VHIEYTKWKLILVISKGHKTKIERLNQIKSEGECCSNHKRLIKAWSGIEGWRYLITVRINIIVIIVLIQKDLMIFMVVVQQWSRQKKNGLSWEILS
jgi:hypothetical protein